MADLTEHFSLTEFRCKDGTPTPPEAVENLEGTAEMLEALRARLAARYGRECALVVLSGYRSLAYNAKVGGASKSMHLVGRAADVTSPCYSPEQVQAIAFELQDDGIIGGVGVYQTFTHVDTGRIRTWKGGFTG